MRLYGENQKVGTVGDQNHFFLIKFFSQNFKNSRIIFDNHWEKHRGQADLDEAKILSLLLGYVNGHEFLSQRTEEEFEYYVFENFAEDDARGYTLVLTILQNQNEEIWVHTCHPDRRITYEQENREKKSTEQGRHRLPVEGSRRKKD